MWRGVRPAAVLGVLMGLWPLPCLAQDDGAQWSDADAGPDPEDAIPDKVGAEVHLSKQERSALRKLDCKMCEAVVSEMYEEVVRHDMTSGGFGAESKVWETSNAMCLALLQRYRLDVSGPKLERKDPDEDDEDSMAMSGNDPGAYMRNMLVLKMGCQRWLEDYGGDTSGFIFKTVRDKTATAKEAAKDYCVNRANLCGGEGRKEKKRKEKEEKERLKKREAMAKVADLAEEKKTADDPFKSLPEDSKFGLQRMLEMARDDPFHYMEDDAKERVRKAQGDLRCDVCRAVIAEVHREVAKKPKSLQREYDILPLFDGACDGGRDLSLPAYFGVEPPPLPPVWTDRLRPHLKKKSNIWALRSFPEKAAKARRKWRKLSEKGGQKPPQQEEAEGDMMMTLACKDVLDAARMTEALYEQMAVCSRASSPGCDAAAAAAQALCRSAEGAACAAAAGEAPRAQQEL